jgi:hypothetical protein
VTAKHFLQIHETGGTAFGRLRRDKQDEAALVAKSSVMISGAGDKWP